MRPRGTEAAVGVFALLALLVAPATGCRSGCSRTETRPSPTPASLAGPDTSVDPQRAFVDAPPMAIDTSGYVASTGPRACASPPGDPPGRCDELCAAATRCGAYSECAADCALRRPVMSGVRWRELVGELESFPCRLLARRGDAPQPTQQEQAPWAGVITWVDEGEEAGPYFVGRVEYELMRRAKVDRRVLALCGSFAARVPRCGPAIVWRAEAEEIGSDDFDGFSFCAGRLWNLRPEVLAELATCRNAPCDQLLTCAESATCGFWP